MDSTIVAALIEKDQSANGKKDEQEVIPRSIEDNLIVNNNTKVTTDNKDDIVVEKKATTDKKDDAVVETKVAIDNEDVVTEKKSDDTDIEKVICNNNLNEATDKTECPKIDDTSSSTKAPDKNVPVSNDKKDIEQLNDEKPSSQNPQVAAKDDNLNSSSIKSRGNIFYKKKGTFTSWKTLFVVIDESSQHMNFYKSKDDYEKIARCKLTVDLRFVIEIKPHKQPLLQNKFPFILYRRAGLSKVKLATGNEDDRAKWITIVEEVCKTSQDLLDKEKEKSATGDSTTKTSDSDPENDANLIRPKKVVNAGGFRIDSNVISNVKLRRTSSENRRYQQDCDITIEKCDSTIEKHDPEDKFGISLRKTNSERLSANRNGRERSPEYIEFKQKFNSLSLSRKKNAKLPLNDNSTCSQLMENLSIGDKPAISDTSDQLNTLKEHKESPRRRSPSPNIPISKGVETFVKNSTDKEEEEEEKEEISKSKVVEIIDVTSVDQSTMQTEDQLFENTNLTTIDEKTNNETVIIPIIQLENHDDDIVSESKSSITYVETGHQTSPAPEEETLPPDDLVSQSDSSKELESKKEIYSKEDPVKDTSNEVDDPLKVRAIKQFIYRMNSDVEEKSKLERKRKSVGQDNEEDLNDSVTNTIINTEIVPTQNNLLNSSDTSSSSKEDSRLSYNSYISQLSTESDEPLPRLNFMGNRSNRSSLNSNITKENICSDEGKSDGEEVIDSPQIFRQNPKLLKRPESSSSLGGRSSLVSPEFTVVEEKTDDLLEKGDDLLEKGDDLLEKDYDNDVDKNATEQTQEKSIEKELENDEIVTVIDDIVVHVAIQQETESFTEELMIESIVEDHEPKNKESIETKLLLNDEGEQNNKVDEVKFTTELDDVEKQKSDSDDEFEVIDRNEMKHCFPTDGVDTESIQLRLNSDFLGLNDNTNMRTSGIEGLKDYLEDNQTDSIQVVNSDINKLGHSLAIEKLKSELPN